LGSIGSRVSYFIINEKPLPLFDMNFIENGQSLQSSGQAKSVITVSSQNYTFNAEGQFETLEDNVTLLMKPTNWDALVPAIQSSSQIKIRMTIASGPVNVKFLLRDITDNSGFYCRIHGANFLWFFLQVVSLENGNTGQGYYFFLTLTLSMIPNLYDVEHEWRFEHKNLTGDPDGYVEAEVYCDDVLLTREKFNNTNIGEAQKAIGYNQNTDPNNSFSLLLGNTGSKVSYVTINEKPL
jgi:hypothetical protein